jgi:hypothetical protein
VQGAFTVHVNFPNRESNERMYDRLARTYAEQVVAGWEPAISQSPYVYDDRHPQDVAFSLEAAPVEQSNVLADVANGVTIVAGVLTIGETVGSWLFGNGKGR